MNRLQMLQRCYKNIIDIVINDCYTVKSLRVILRNLLQGHADVQEVL